MSGQLGKKQQAAKKQAKKSKAAAAVPSDAVVTSGGQQQPKQQQQPAKAPTARQLLVATPSSPSAAAAPPAPAATTSAATAPSYGSVEDFSTRVEIYRGRHSVVWNVVCKATKRPLILKGYVKAKMTERNFHQVRREIRLMKLIAYEGAVKILGDFEDDTTIYIVQEICSKGDLFKKLIRSGGVMDEKYVASEVILPLLLTLQHLHSRKIYHRDIKPENIFFMKDGHMKLGDFGLAIDATLERPKSRVGTLDYMSPEVVSLPTADERKKMQAEGKAIPEKVYDDKVDVWAAGILAFELLTGKPPFEVANEQETRKRIMYETTLRFPPAISTDAINFIITALAKNAVVRPDASELLNHPWIRPHLAAAMTGSGGGAAAALLRLQRSSAMLAAVPAAAAPLNVLGGSGAAKAANAAAGANGNSSTGATLLGRAASFTALGAGSLRPLLVSLGEASSSMLPSKLPQTPGSAPPLAGIGPGPLAGGLGSPGSPVMPSPTASDAPMTPGPYGPPGGGGRKPVWDADRSFTAARTVGLDSLAASPLPPGGGSTLSPGRSKLGGGGSAAPGALAAPPASPGGNPLLKAALNAGLHKLPGGIAAPPVTATAPRVAAAGGAVSRNVKSRIKEYFVARSTNEVGKGGGAGTLT